MSYHFTFFGSLAQAQQHEECERNEKFHF